MLSENWRMYFGCSSWQATESARHGWNRMGLDAGGKNLTNCKIILYFGTRRIAGYSFHSMAGAALDILDEFGVRRRTEEADAGKRAGGVRDKCRE